MPLYKIEIPATTYLVDFDSYHVSVSIDLDIGTSDHWFTDDEREAIHQGEAHPVSVTVTLYREVLGQRVPVDSDTMDLKVYGTVDGVPVTPVPHPLSPELLDTVMELLIREGTRHGIRS